MLDEIRTSYSSGVRLSKHLARFVAVQLSTVAREMLRLRGRQMSMTFLEAHYPILRAVLITFTPLKRVVAEPWLTDDTWAGWPLPSKKVPNMR